MSVYIFCKKKECDRTYAYHFRNNSIIMKSSNILSLFMDAVAVANTFAALIFTEIILFHLER